MSKTYPSKAAKFVELSWYCSVEKQSKLAEQWNDAHFVGKSKRDDEHLLVPRGLIRSGRAGRRQARVERWNLGSVKAVWSRLWELKASTEIDTLVARQKYITNNAEDEHRHLFAQDALGKKGRSVEHDLRPVGPKRLLKQNHQVFFLQTSNRRVQVWEKLSRQ